MQTLILKARSLDATTAGVGTCKAQRATQWIAWMAVLQPIPEAHSMMQHQVRRIGLGDLRQLVSEPGR